METMKTSQTITSPYAPDVVQVREWLERMVAALRFIEIVTAVIALVTRMRDINTELTRQLRKGRVRSETLDRLNRQLSLPMLATVQAVVKPKEQEENGEEKRAKKRRSKHPGRAALPANLERIPVVNGVRGQARMCPRCGVEMTTVGHSKCEILDIVPARLVVIERFDERVACPFDDTIVSAPTPPAIVQRGKLGDTLIVEALCDKYLEHQPIERQCTRWQRTGVDIEPQTLGRGVATAIDVLEPVARLIEVQTRAPGVLATDATSIPILDPEVPDGIRNGTMWCWTNARWVRFVYSAVGDSASVKRFLGDDLARTVQCDGTNITTFIERSGGKRPGCWSHGRRRFVEAARMGDRTAVEGLHIIAPLFVIERDSTRAGDNAVARQARRHVHSRPVLDELKTWLDAHRDETPPNTPLGEALGYLHRQWPRLLLFLEDGNIELTNNRRERELRRLVLGRRNWLFTWLDAGGERTADILSIVGTCIAHEVNPRAYLHLVANLIVRGWSNAKLRDLLPDRMLVEHPELYIGETALARA
jgi:transposase